MTTKLAIATIFVAGLASWGCSAGENPEPEQSSSGWTVTGASAIALTGTDAGESPDAYPQIKFISSQEHQAMKDSGDIPETGLYLVDTDYVPSNLSDLLTKQSVTLTSDGMLLDEKGEPATLFMTVETMGLIRGDTGPSGKSVSNVPSAAKQTQATPYAWYGGWATSRNEYHYRDGLCRRFKAYITAAARSLVGGEWLYTNIEYIQTKVSFGSDTSTNHCYNCSDETTSKSMQCDCVIPLAHIHSGSQYFYMKDGNVTATKTYSF